MIDNVKPIRVTIAEIQARIDALPNVYIQGINGDSPAVNRINGLQDIVVDLAGEVAQLTTRLAAAREAARKLVAQVENLGAFADDNDPRVMATAGPLGEAQADLWLALGMPTDRELARMRADIDSRCAVCGWPLAESVEAGCVRGNCSMRPRPEKLYAPERAAREARHG